MNRNWTIFKLQYVFLLISYLGVVLLNGYLLHFGKYIFDINISIRQCMTVPSQIKLIKINILSQKGNTMHIINVLLSLFISLMHPLNSCALAGMSKVHLESCSFFQNETDVNF